MTPSTVHVVVPAHNEERRVGRCVVALGAAVAAVRRELPEVVVTTTLVLDRCTDHTLARALENAGDSPWEVVTVDAGCVGAARHAGVRYAVSTTSRIAPQATWLSTTDADSVVGESWLLDHLALAHDHDLIVGRVHPDPDELSVPALAEWRRRHDLGGLHVHGANLGLRLSTYLAVGGFAPVPEHEDVMLVDAARRTGARWTQGSIVTTSARSVGRVGGGFSDYVRGLEDDVRDSRVPSAMR